MTILLEYANAKIETEKDGATRLVGVAIKSNFVNSNKRWYPREMMEDAVQDLRAKIDSKTAYSTLGHTSDLNLEHDKIAGLVEGIRRNGDDWTAKIKLLDLPYGNIAKELVKHGSLGFSTKGAGDLKPHKDGYNVVENYKLAQLDLVGTPSSGAYCSALKESILSESLSEDEKEIAMGLLATHDTPSLIDRAVQFISEGNLGMAALEKLGHGIADMQRDREYDNSGGIYDGSAAFPSLDDPGKCHYDRMQELTLKIIANLLGLEDDMENVDSSQFDDTGLNTRHSAGYVKRTLQSKWDRNLEDTVRKMLRQPNMQKRMQQFKAQQDFNYKTLSRIFKNKI